MQRKTIRAIVIALAMFLLATLGVAAQAELPVSITTTERVPIQVDVGDTAVDGPAAGTTNAVTVTLIITKEMVVVGSEVVSHSVQMQVDVPPDAPLAVADLATPDLAVDVDVAAPAATAIAEESTGDPAEDTGARVNRGANLRGGPGTNYPVVGGASEGDPVEIVGQNADGSWYELASGAWIAAFLVDNAPAGLPIAEAPPVSTPAPQAAAPAPVPGSLTQQIADATAAIERNPNDATAYFDRGYAYFQQENFQAALADMNRAIELEPQAAVAYFIRGVTYSALGNCGQAVQDFTQAINLSPGYPNVYEQRAICYLEMELYALALPDLETLLELSPDHPERSGIESLIQQIRQAL